MKNIEMQEIFTNDSEELKKKQTEMKKVIIEGVNSRTTGAEEWMSDLEDRMMEKHCGKQNIEETMKIDEDRLIDLWNTKHINIHIIGIPIRKKESV